MSEFFNYDFPVVVTAKHTIYVHSPPMLTLFVLKRDPVAGIIRTCRFKNDRSDLCIRTYPDCQVVNNIFMDWSGAKAVLVDDFLYVYEPDTGAAFSVNASSQSLVLGHQFESA